MRPGAVSRGSAVGIALGWLAASACSVLVSHADSQCAVDGDCAKFGAFACVAGGCVSSALTNDADADAPFSGTCTSTAQCLAAHNGLDWICRHVDGTCVPLLSPDCTTVLGQYTSDDTVLLGAILPLYGPHASTGAGLTDALRLAVSDLGAGIPSASTPGVAARPLAVVVCNESTEVNRAAIHLRSDLLVPGIVGTGESATTLDVAHDITVTGGLLLISPRATADLSSVSGTGLVWRTCPSFSYEAAAIVALAQQYVVPQVATANGLTTVRVALVHATDVESTELDSAITAALQINGALATATSNDASFLHVDFGDPDSLADVDASGTFASAVDAVTVAGSLPDVIILVGSTQAVPNVLAAVEQRWPSGARLPHYILSSGLQTTELLALVGANDAVDAGSAAPLRTRVLGTAPGGNGANVQAFQSRYANAFADGTSPQSFGVAQAYDGLYALALAEAVTTAAAPLGTDLSTALETALTLNDASSPVSVDIGPGALASALAALAGGHAVTLNGASAPLAFATKTGDVVTDVQVWCMVPGAAPSPVVFQRSGVAYSATGAALTGVGIAAACTQ